MSFKPDDETNAAPPPAKRPYEKPELVEFGNVRAITQAGTGTMADNQMMRK